MTDIHHAKAKDGRCNGCNIIIIYIDYKLFILQFKSKSKFKKKNPNSNYYQLLTYKK